MPAVLTPGGVLDLSSVLFRNCIIFIGQPVNSQVAQRVISQLLTLATIDEDSDMLVWLYFYLGIFFSTFITYKYGLQTLNLKAWFFFISDSVVLPCEDVSELPWWKHLLCVGNLQLHVMGKVLYIFVIYLFLLFYCFIPLLLCVGNLPLLALTFQETRTLIIWLKIRCSLYKNNIKAKVSDRYECYFCLSNRLLDVHNKQIWIEDKSEHFLIMAE